MATTKIPQELLEKTSITFADNEKLNFGTDNDLQIYSSGSYSFIREVGTGGLYLDTNGDGIYLRGTTGNENMVKAIKDGAVELYHNGIKKFYTNASGVDIIGTAALTGGITVQDDQVAYFGTGLDLRISHVSSIGSNLIQSYTSGELVIESNGNTKIRTNNADDMAKFLKNGAVELYYDNVKKFETTTAGVAVFGEISNATAIRHANSGAQVIDNDDNTYLKLNDPEGAGRLWLGDSGDATNIYRNTTHRFVNADVSTEYMRINATGVGIGTNNPAHPLHVYEDGGYYLSFDRGNSTPGGPDPWLGLFNNVLINNATYGWGFYDSNSDGSLQLWNKNNSTTGYNVITFKRGGNVGIGTNAPAEKLEVSGGHIKITNTGNTNLYINANNAGSDATIFFKEEDSVKAKIQHDASNDSMLFTDGAYTDTMTIKGAKVGIGTTSPSAPLDVAGIVRISESSNTAFYGGDYVRLFGAQAFGFKNTGGSTIAQVSLTGNSYFNGGNVGIGITNPSARLDVRSSADPADGTLMFLRNDVASGNGAFIRYDVNNVGDWAIGIPDNRNAFTIWKDQGNTGTEYFTVNSNGNVGIGTATPATTLHVTNSTTNAEVMRLTTTGDDPDRNMYFQSDHIYSNGNFYLGTGSHRNLYRGSYHTFHYGGSNTEAMRIDASGNVGIGTVTPAEMLNVESDSASPAILVKAAGQTSSTSPTAELILSPGSLSSNDSACKVIAYRTGDYSSAAVRSNGLKFQTTNANAPVTAMTITNAGNVGIGNTNPNLPLTVTSNSGANAIAIRARSADDYGFIQFYNHAGTALRGQIFNHNGAMAISTDTTGTARLHIDTSGKVGIGTTSPGHKLSFGANIPSDGKTITVYEDGNIASGIGVVSGVYRNFTNETSALSFGHYAHSDGTTYTERMRINSSGNVGINTSAPKSMHATSTSGATTMTVAGTIGSGYPMGEGATYDTTVPRIYRDWFMYNSAASIGSNIYVHMKTNLWGGGSPAGNTEYTMSHFRYHGYYAYGGNTTPGGHVGWHNWSGSFYNGHLVNEGTLALAQSSYISSDGYVVLVAKIGAGYAQFSIDWHQWAGYTFRERKVTAVTRTASANGAY